MFIILTKNAFILRTGVVHCRQFALGPTHHRSQTTPRCGLRLHSLCPVYHLDEAPGCEYKELTGHKMNKMKRQEDGNNPLVTGTHVVEMFYSVRSISIVRGSLSVDQLTQTLWFVPPGFLHVLPDSSFKLFFGGFFITSNDPNLNVCINSDRVDISKMCDSCPAPCSVGVKM